MRRLRLGEYGDVTPAQARKRAIASRGLVAMGGDPWAERKATLNAEAAARLDSKRQAAAETYTLRMLIAEWERVSLADRSKSYRTEATRALRVGFAPLLDRPAHAIRRADLQKLLDTMTKAKPGRRVGPPAPPGAPAGQVIARRTRTYGHAMYAWGVRRALVAANPFAETVTEGRDTGRERVLSDAELGEVWRATGKLGWPWGPFFRFLLLTIQREAETAGLQWGELAPDLATWELPGHRTKNGRPHVVHLAEPARAVLRDVPRIAAARRPAVDPAASPHGAQPAALVFTMTGRVPISGFSNAKERLDRLIVAARHEAAAIAGREPAPLVPWRLHDFRRSGVTVMARKGVQVAVADKILNHSQGAIRGVAAVYQRHDFMAEREAAMQLWAAHVLAVADDTES